MAFAAASDGGGGGSEEVVPLIDVPASQYEGVRIHSISDIHVDYKSNLQWCVLLACFVGPACLPVCLPACRPAGCG